MLNLCIALARLPRVSSADVELLCYMAGELTRLGVPPEVVEKVKIGMVVRLIEGEGLRPGSFSGDFATGAATLESKWATYHLNRLSEVTAPGWTVSDLATDVLMGYQDREPDEPATLDEIEAMQDDPGRLERQGWIWPYIRVAGRAIHSGQTALDAGDIHGAFTLAAAAVAAIDCDTGTGIGDDYEIPEALGVLLARIACYAVPG